MRALVIKFFVVVYIAYVNANVLKDIFSGFRGNPNDEHEEDCRDEQHSHLGFPSTRFKSFTSPGTFWRRPTSPKYDDFVDRFSPPSGHDHNNKDRKREDTTRYTTERWRPSEDIFGTGGKDERDVLVPKQTSTSFPQRAKTTSGEAFGNEVEKDSFEGLDEVKMRLAEKWCSRYEKKCVSRRTTRNGLTTRIIGGRRAEPKKHPHMVMIGYGVGDKKQWLCGGSLISSRFVLSAAHCSQTAKGPAKWVLLGELDISTTDDDARPQEKEIVERLRHPSYQEPATYHDIALFKMDSDVVFNSWVYPACLHLRRTVPSSSGTVTGWGRTGFVSDISNELLEVDVSIFNDSLCTRTVNKLAGPKMPRGYDPTTMICAGDIAGGKDACQGDSGGPLVIRDDSCIKTQVGITSIGSECGLPESPGVYTRVSEYISWIEDIVWS